MKHCQIKFRLEGLEGVVGMVQEVHMWNDSEILPGEMLMLSLLSTLFQMHKISWFLCNSRMMDCNFLELLVHGTPTEIHLRDCSWLSEEQFVKIFVGCNTSKLMTTDVFVDGHSNLQVKIIGLKMCPIFTLVYWLKYSSACDGSLNLNSVCTSIGGSSKTYAVFAHVEETCIYN